MWKTTFAVSVAGGLWTRNKKTPAIVFTKKVQLLWSPHRDSPPMKNPRSTSKISNDVPFSAEQIHAFRLRRHHLLDRSAKDLVTICRDVCGVQAQIMCGAAPALGAQPRHHTRHGE